MRRAAMPPIAIEKTDSCLCRFLPVSCGRRAVSLVLSLVPMMHYRDASSRLPNPRISHPRNHWRRQLWGTGARAPLDFQLAILGITRFTDSDE